MLIQSSLADTELDRQLYLDLKLVISDNDVLKVTRMTEAHGVAVRFPFLDHRLAEFAGTVPAQYLRCKVPNCGHSSKMRMPIFSRRMMLTRNRSMGLDCRFRFG